MSEQPTQPLSKDQIIMRLLNLNDPTDNDQNEAARLIQIRMQTGAAPITADEKELLTKANFRKLLKSILYPVIAAAQTIIIIWLVRV
jgi:hypothetical protein